VVGWLRQRRVAEPDLADLAVVVSELLSNAVQAGIDHDTRMGVRLVDAAVHIEVVNRVHGPTEIAPGLPGPDAPTGRGLYVAQALVDRLDIAIDDGWAQVSTVKAVEVETSPPS
jgi:anti-sigma regulatory factor (Ser/Thr protein kinase)